MTIENKSTLTNEKLENLILDINNPRFAELYSGSNKEEDLIEYLLYTEAAEDIAKAMVQVNEFYPDEPLWVLKDGNKYLVKDGNRRCAAVKSLQVPDKYQLGLKRFKLDKLPILIFEDENYLNQRIKEKHTSSLFRKWERIAKALEVCKLYSSGNSITSMIEIDSKPADLIKLASFYYEAEKIGGEDLKKLLRRGRGRTGGKTIIFERMFKHSKLCGYSFKNKPSYEIKVFDKDKFSQYVSAMIRYLEEHPKVKHQDIDNRIKEVFRDLKEYGFKSLKTTKNKRKSTNSQSSRKKGSVKHNPDYERKQVPSALDRIIKECYNLDQNNFSNAKIALTRVAFECTLKYAVESTKYNGKKNISECDFFRNAFFNRRGEKLQFTNFEILKTKFTELIINTGKKKAFEDFDLNRPHQIIHNYDVGAIPNDAKGLCDNLIPLIEFMLQEENDLLSSLDLTKL